MVGFAVGAAAWELRPTRASVWAWRNRLASAALVAGCLGAFGLAIPERPARVEAEVLFVLTLGYGHLLGAAVFARRRIAALRPAGWTSLLFWSLLAATTANALVLYAWLGRSHGGIFVPLLVVSVWHIAENDLALSRAYRQGLRLGPVERGPAASFGSLGITLLVLVAAAATLPPDDARVLLEGTGLAAMIPSRPATPALDFGDVFSGVTLYHLVSWLIFLADRGAAAAGERRVPGVRRLLWVHVPPAAVCAGVLCWPGAGGVALQHVLFSPGLYLFWSVLHVAQTALVRRHSW